MNQAKACVANWLWRLSCEPARRRMERALRDPAAAQARVLERILRDHAGCAYARQHRLEPGMGRQRFCERLPVSTYETLEPWIERLKRGEKNGLFCGDLLAFERSSGSTSAAKWIPFNAGLRAEFQEAVRAWMGDLFRRHPALLKGRAWWLTSPLPRTGETTEAGIPVGLEGDEAYLGWLERTLASWLRAVPAMARGGATWEEHLDHTAGGLMRARDVRLLSVWNPSFLEILWRRIELKAGPGITPQALWPHLTLVSAWGDGWAAIDARASAARFPRSVFQAKGLLATEGVISLPWGDDAAAAVPALTSHYLEFEGSPGGAILPVHELEEGREYAVLLTTSGGLWRYRLGDLVRVEGHEKATPRLRFAGRMDGVCDLRGEKLNPRFVKHVLDASGCRGFAMLAPSVDGPVPRYVLFTDQPGLDAGLVETGLLANPYYAHARGIGQLDGVALFLIQETHAPEAYLRRCVHLGQRAGTVKTTALHRTPGWEPWFQGNCNHENRED